MGSTPALLPAPVADEHRGLLAAGGRSAPVDGRPAGQLALEVPGLLGLEAVLLAPCLTTAIHFAVCVSQRLIQNCSLVHI